MAINFVAALSSAPKSAGEEASATVKIATMIGVRMERSSAMEISVIVCTHNRSAILRQTLLSLSDMELPKDLCWEILVVDNNSTDDTRRVVESLGACELPNLRYVFERQQGLSFARNRGIAEAKGEIVTFTDDDVVVAKDWLAEIRKAFQEFQPACVSGRILLHPDLRLPAWWDRRWNGSLSELDLGDQVILDEFGYGANMSFRRETLAKYGLFRTNLGRTNHAPAMGEETELMFRLRLGEERLVYYPKAIVYHRPSVARLSKKYLRRWFYQYGISLHQIDLVRFRSGRWLGGVPLWRYRWAGDVLGSAAFIWITGGSRERFHQELRVICLMGYSASAFKQRFRSPIRVES